MNYYELWNVMSQWRDEFSTRDFASTFAGPDPNKVLHDLSKKGLLEKIGRARYKVVRQDEYVRKNADVEAAYDAVNETGLEYAFTGPDAVSLWTKGGYNADRFFGYYPIVMKVRRRDLAKWQSFFASERKRWAVQGKAPAETLYGIFYQVRPVEKLSKARIEGYSVDSLDETVKFCKENLYTYEPALEMLDEMYGLGLGTRYRESR